MRLSPRQRQVLIKIVEGKSDKQIAKEFGLSVNTVKSHVQKVCQRMEANGDKSRLLAACKAVRLGIA